MQETSYDVIPYESAAFPQTHPDRLATLARLFGVEAPAVDQCRVLELGAARGDNIIPMAYSLPESQFIGVDLSTRQVAEGNANIEAHGLSNVELRYLSIADIGEDFGLFDYIICHGVYSWVPDAVRDRILAVCRSHLVPNGVAYISYNTYPGWHMRGLIREMMRYHASQFEGPQLQIQQARALLDFLAQSVPPQNAYGMLLTGELEGLRRQADSYLFHEHLEEVNSPVYFYQFAQQAAAHGLQFLAEADFSTMLASNFPPQVRETLKRIAPDLVRMEQYMDFVRNRTFRQTLLVHGEQVLNRNLSHEHVRRFYIASAAKPVSEKPDLHSDTMEQFRPCPLRSRLSRPR